MADNLYNGDMSQLADGINNFFQSVSADLEPLDDSVIPALPDVITDFWIQQLATNVRDVRPSATATSDISTGSTRSC